MESTFCIIDGSQGIYIPAIFAQRVKAKDIIICNNQDTELMESFDVCASGPENDFYWESWDYILDNCAIQIGNFPYELMQDGDLFAVRIDDDITDVEF